MKPYVGIYIWFPQSSTRNHCLIFSRLNHQSNSWNTGNIETYLINFKCTVVMNALVVNILDLTSETWFAPKIKDNYIPLTSFPSPQIIGQGIFHILPIFQTFQQTLQGQTLTQFLSQPIFLIQEIFKSLQQLQTNLGIQGTNDILNRVYNLARQHKSHSLVEIILWIKKIQYAPRKTLKYTRQPHKKIKKLS